MAPQTTEEIERTPMSISGHSSLVYVNPQSPSCSMSGISPFVAGIPSFATSLNTLPTAQIAATSLADHSLSAQPKRKRRGTNDEGKPTKMSEG